MNYIIVKDEVKVNNIQQESYGIKYGDKFKLSNIITDYSNIKIFVNSLNMYKADVEYLNYLIEVLIQK